MTDNPGGYVSTLNTILSILGYNISSLFKYGSTRLLMNKDIYQNKDSSIYKYYKYLVTNHSNK